MGYLASLIGGGCDFRNKKDYQKYRIFQALQEAHVMSFADLQGMTYEDIDDLTYHVKKKDPSGHEYEVKKKVLSSNEESCRLETRTGTLSSTRN